MARRPIARVGGARGGSGGGGGGGGGIMGGSCGEILGWLNLR